MMFDKNSLWHALQQIEAQRSQMNDAAKLVETYLAQQDAAIQRGINSLQPAWEQMSLLAKLAFRHFREAYPPNWPDDLELEWIKLEQISEKEGIPVFYVPRAEIVVELLEAADLKERMSIIERRSDDIAQDCAETLSLQVDDQLTDRSNLALKATRAFLEGHHESAQALATAVCDSYLQTYLTGRYKDIDRKSVV